MRIRGTGSFLLPLIVGALLLAAAVPADAIVFEHNDQIHITNLHRINDDLYAFGTDITIDGVVDGELAAFSNSVRIAGNITGTANLFAYEVRIPGQIDRSVRIFARECEIDGTIGQSALIFGQNVTLDRSAVIERSAAIYGEVIRMYGSIGGGPNSIEAKNITFEGSSGGDLRLEGERIVISSSAVIDGDLTYQTRKEGDITIEDGAVITGEVTWSPPKVNEEEESGSTMTSGVLAISKLLAAFLFGIIVVMVFGRYAEESYRQIRTRFTVSFAAGLVSLLALIFVIAILSVSIILMVAGLIVNNPIIGAMLLVFSILMVPITIFSTVVGGIIFYSGKILLGFLIGALILRRAKTSAALNKVNLLIGLVVLTIFFEIPYIGFAVYLFVAIAGAGAIVLGIRHCPRVHALQAEGPSAAPETPPTPPTPPDTPTGPPPPEPPPRPGGFSDSDR